MSDFVTTLKQDKDKVTLTNADFIDKVINLKLFVANPDGTLKDTYVIRSDYELYYPDLMNNIVYNDMQSFISSKRCFIQKFTVLSMFKQERFMTMNAEEYVWKQTKRDALKRK